MKTRIFLLIGLMVFAGSALVLAVEGADLILFNGKIITVDAPCF